MGNKKYACTVEAQDGSIQELAATFGKEHHLCTDDIAELKKHQGAVASGEAADWGRHVLTVSGKNWARVFRLMNVEIDVEGDRVDPVEFREEKVVNVYIQRAGEYVLFKKDVEGKGKYFGRGRKEEG